MIVAAQLVDSAGAQAQSCDFLPNAAITLTAVGGNNTAGFSTRFVLTDSGGIIQEVATNAPSFSGRPPGAYLVYAINYQTTAGINNLVVGQEISAVNGPCVAVSAGLVVLVCACDYVSNQAITFNATGGNASVGFTTQYALTDGAGVIVAISGTTGFPAQPVGGYAIYAINYRTSTGISNLSVGQPISALTGECFDVSSALAIGVCATNNPPLANDDGASTSEDASVVVDVTANDSDPDGNLDVSTVSVVSEPSRSVPVSQIR